MSAGRNGVNETNPAGVSVGATLEGILDDLGSLFRQQIAMLRAEIRAELGKALRGFIYIVCAVAPLLLGQGMLCFALVHWLHWMTMPADQTVDPAALPLWACYGVVAAAFLVAGGVLLGMGIFRLRRVRGLPAETVRAFEENIQWLKHRSLS